MFVLKQSGEFPFRNETFPVAQGVRGSCAREALLGGSGSHCPSDGAAAELYRECMRGEERMAEEKAGSSEGF